MQELKCIQIQILLFSAQHLIETTTKKNSKVMYLQRKKNQYIRYLNLHKAQTHLKRKLVLFCLENMKTQLLQSHSVSRANYFEFEATKKSNSARKP